MENVKELAVHHLANVVRAKTDQVLVVDSRTFCEFNTSHVIGSVNVWSSKIRKKRLQQSSMSVQDYLSSACEVRRCADFGRQWSQIIVYDQSAPGLTAVPNDSFLYVLLDKLSSFYKNVHLLVGGFLEFQSQYPDCCEDATQKCSPLTSLSQPCLPVANVGPTRILPFLYLGSQHDANNRQMLQDYSVLYELNVSASCPKPDFVQDSHFLRIPVNDNFSEKLTPYFFDAFHFIDKVRESGGSVLVHCLAGISRSATVAIAYVMKHLHLPYEEAYRYVKNRRPTISPNINFVGQLLELDKLLRTAGVLCDPSSAPPSFRQPGALPSTPYGATITSITSNTSFSLDYAVNNKTTSSAGVLSDAASASCYSLSSLASSTSFRNSENTSAGISSSFDGTHNTSNCNILGDSVSRSGCYVTSSPLASQQSNTGGNVSLTHITQDAPLPFATPYCSTANQTSSATSVSPQCHATRSLSLGLYSKSSNISTQFGKGTSSSTKGEDHRICLKRGAVPTAGSCGGVASTGLGIPRSLSLNLKSTLEVVPGSPGSTPQSPESAATISKLNFGLLSPPSMVESATRTLDSPYMSCDSVFHSPNSQGSPMSSSNSPTTALSKLSFNNNNSSVTGGDSRHYSLMSSRSSSLKSLMSSSNFSQGSKSPTIIEVRKSPTITENVFEAQYSALQSGMVSSNDSAYRATNEESLNNNINRNYYSSTATISVSASDSKNIHKNNNNNSNSSSGIEMIGGNDNRPRSVCIIEVNTETPVTYVENCCSEPMIVRETEVIATPCTQADLRQRVNSSPPVPIPVDKNSNVQYAVPDDDNINSSSTSSANAMDTIDGSATRREKPHHKTLVPIRASASFGNILDRPKVLELCAPIYNPERPVFLGNGAGAFVMGDCTWQTRNPEEKDESMSVCTGVVKPVPFRPTAGLSVFPSSTSSSSSVSSIAPTNLITTSTNSTQTSPTPFRNSEKSNTLGVIHDSESTSVADSSDFNDTASEFSVMQSDSGISFQTDSDSNLHHPIPRCYSSSETHLNTRRLLENSACADYSTRKSCSNDEVAKNWYLHKPLTNMNSHPLPITRDSANSHTNNNFGPMNNSNWNYLGELVRCDSWSTSGLGSELSDWESLQEDANSSNCDDAMGPFDAVFSDVFPGDRSDSLNSPQIYHHVFPQLFRESTGSDEKGNSASGGNSSSLDKKPRHHSFKEPQQRWRQQQQHKQIPLARPASLPGVMGSYLAQIQPNTEPGLGADGADESGLVELRPTSNRGGSVVGGLKRASAGSRDSGYSSSSIGTNSSSGGGGVRRNDCGYYSVTEPPSFSASRPAGIARESSQEESNSSKAQSSATGHPSAVAGSRKPLLKKQPLSTQRPVSLKTPGSRSPASPPPKSPSPPKAQIRRQTSSSPHKSPSPPKSSLPTSRQKSTSPPKPSASYQDSSCLPQRSPSPCKPMSPHRSGTSRTSGSPQPRIFGASTFYLPQSSENSLPSAKSAPAKKSSLSESSTPSSSTSQTKQSTSCVSNSRSLSSNLCSKSTATKASNIVGGIKMTTVGFSSKSPKSGNNSSVTKNTSFSSRPEGLSARHNSKSPSPAFSTSRSPSLECSSSTQNSESSSSIETAYMNKSSSSSSRETSVESDSSIVNKLVSLSTSANAAETSACSLGEYSPSSTSMQAFRTKGTSNLSSSGSGKNSPNFGQRSSSPNYDPCDAEDSSCADFSAASVGERRSPEKRKNRSGSEDSKGKEKRRSCDLDLGASDEHLKKPISLKSGVRLAQELLQSMENIVSSELSEIRRCTAELSSRYRLKPRQRESETIVAGTGGSVPYSAGNGGRKIKAPSSQFYLLPDRPSTPSVVYPSSVSAGGVGVSGGSTSVSAAATAADSVTSSRPHHRLHHHHHHHHHNHHHHQKYTTSSKDSWGAASFASSKEIALSGAITSTSGAGVEDGGERSRSEPPFSGDEGLYRAQSCPGLPLPQQQHLHHQHHYHHQQPPTHLLHQERSDEGHETVAELRRPSEGGVLLRLKTERTPPAREKLLNRYSCGTLDTQKQPLTPPRLDAAFESCPDLATLRGGRACTSDSSSSSVSSSRSSFSRLLPVS